MRNFFVLFVLVIPFQVNAANFSFVNAVDRALSMFPEDSVNSNSKIRISMTLGLGNHPLINLEPNSDSQADKLMAFYLAGNAVYIHSVGDIKTFSAIQKRIQDPSATAWASSFILHNNILSLDLQSGLNQLQELSKNPSLAVLSIPAHRGAAVKLLSLNSETEVEYIRSILSTVSDDFTGLQIALEYLYVFKLLGEHESFSNGFSLSQDRFDQKPNWQDFLNILDSVDLITSYTIDSSIYLQKIETIGSWKLKLLALSYGAQTSIANCEQDDLNWFLDQLFRWGLNPGNPYGNEKRLTMVLHELSSIEAVNVGVWKAKTSKCP